MNTKLALSALLFVGAAAAQTTIGNVTITRPSDVRNITPATNRTPVVTPAPRTAAPARTPSTSAAVAQSSAVAVPSDLPAGWRHLQGRVVAPSDVRLPTGSKVVVSIEELAPNLAHRSTYLKISFSATRLSTPYNLRYSTHRLNPSSIYAVRAKVYDANGRLLYTNNKLHRVPTARAANMNIAVVR